MNEEYQAHNYKLKASEDNCNNLKNKLFILKNDNEDLKFEIKRYKLKNEDFNSQIDTYEAN